MDQRESRFYPRIFGLAAAALLAFALFKILAPFVGPILWSLLLAFLLFPVSRRLRRALNGRRGAAAILLTLAGALLVLIPAVFLGVVFARQAGELVGLLQKAADCYQIAQASDLLRVPAIFLVVWGAAVVSSADNFVRPFFISGRAQIATLPVFLGLMGGLSAFGPIGMVLGPVVVALVLALLRFAEESRRA